MGHFRALLLEMMGTEWETCFISVNMPGMFPLEK